MRLLRTCICVCHIFWISDFDCLYVHLLWACKLGLDSRVYPYLVEHFFLSPLFVRILYASLVFAFSSFSTQRLLFPPLIFGLITKAQNLPRKPREKKISRGMAELRFEFRALILPNENQYFLVNILNGVRQIEMEHPPSIWSDLVLNNNNNY